MLTVDEAHELHQRVYDGGTLTDEEAADVSRWILSLVPNEASFTEFMLALFLSRYVKDGLPA